VSSLVKLVKKKQLTAWCFLLTNHKTKQLRFTQTYVTSRWVCRPVNSKTNKTL